MALACVNVDLDSLVHYCRIHGLPEAVLPEASRGLVYEVALPRFLELFEEVELPATLFAIGEDLENETAARGLARAVEAGHEAGNHSYSHDYGLTRRTEAEIVEDVERGDARIAEATGRAPCGFRAPGYAMSASLLQSVSARGYRYDSSVFPAVPYYFAKAAVMGTLVLSGQPSEAILDRPRVLLAPTEPYRPDEREPYRRGGAPLIELPVAVAPLSRVPFIGTLVTSFPQSAVSALYRLVRRLPFLNFELHGIDLLDESDVEAPALARVQRDLRIDWRTKRSRLLKVLQRIGQDYETVTLAEAADRYAPLLPG